MELQAEAPDREVVLVHHQDERGVWATRGRTIFHALPGGDASGASWSRIGSFPAAPVTDYLGIGRLPRRFLRSEKCNVYPTRSGKLLGIRQRVVYRLDAAGGPKALFEIHGDCVMNRAIAEDADGNLFFGEYFGNPERGPVRIWKVFPDLESFELAYTLEAGRTRHIHAIHMDPFHEKRIWVTMGDYAAECYLAYTDDSFESLHFLGDGSQLWRMVGIVFQENRLCWLTDSHIEQNHIVSMDRASESAPEIHGDRDASCWFVAETSDGVYLATTTVERGAGIQTTDVRLLASEDGLEWEPVATYPTDRYPMQLGFGSLSLPSGDFPATGFWISGEGVREVDGRSRLCRLVGG